MSVYKCAVCGFEYDEDKGYIEMNIKPGTKWEDIPNTFRCPWCGANKEDFYLLEDKEVKNEPYKTYRCAMCGFEYHEEEGYPEAGIKPGTRWAELPSDFTCPMCGAAKEDFYLVEEETKTVLEKKEEKKEEKKVEGNFDKYVCALCGYVYDEAIGEPELGIKPGTKFEDLPSDFHCPRCGADKAEFYKKEEEEVEDLKEMSPILLSAICSNLGRGYEKQYKGEGSKLYYELADYFKKKAEKQAGDIDKINGLVNDDLGLFTLATEQVNKDKDRGAYRSIVWAEKVTKMVSSLVKRYQKGEDFDKLTVYVCTVCGFIFVGDKLPEVCPVCKVPNFKFERVL